MQVWPYEYLILSSTFSRNPIIHPVYVKIDNNFDRYVKRVTSWDGSIAINSLGIVYLAFLKAKREKCKRRSNCKKKKERERNRRKKKLVSKIKKKERKSLLRTEISFRLVEGFFRGRGFALTNPDVINRGMVP